MTISKNITTFADRPVKLFEGELTGDIAATAWKVGFDYDSENQLSDQFLALCADPGAAQVEALVIGVWDEEMFDTSADNTLSLFASNAAKLPALRHIFFGDVTFEECEISWIINGNHTPLLDAFPRLSTYVVRGGMGLRFEGLRHGGLRSLTVQTGGLSGATLTDLAAAVLPNLEELELWIGTPNYEGTDDVDDIMPFLGGKLFPKLKRLGLKNAEMQDDIALAAAGAPVLAQLRHLDLSMGTMGDEGAAALADSPLVAALESLDVSKNYLSGEAVARLQGLACTVNTDAQRDEEDPDDRYCSVSE